MEYRENGRSFTGRIEVITGGMFSGKSEELHRRIRRSMIAGLKVVIFQPAVDTRSKPNTSSTRLGREISAETVFSSKEIIVEPDVRVVGIDEAQFFDNELPSVVTYLADNGVQVIVAGLDQDFNRNPFSPMPYIMAIAENVDKVHAVCVKCGRDASYSHRTGGGKAQVEIGDTESYEALCRFCYLIVHNS